VQVEHDVRVLAAYTKTVSEEIVGFSARADANASLDRVLHVAKEKLDCPRFRRSAPTSRKVRARSKS
jgi:hypothetical protein